MILNKDYHYSHHDHHPSQRSDEPTEQLVGLICHPLHSAENRALVLEKLAIMLFCFLKHWEKMLTITAPEF